MVIAEELVSGIFINIWEKRNYLQINHSVKSYLYTSVKNTSLNYLKSQFASIKFESDAHLSIVKSPDKPTDQIDYLQLEEIVRKGTESLPPKCRIIFTLSRHAGMSYQEIADELGISKKTVKAQMGIALHKMREYIGKHWDSLLFILLPLLK
jgi:RNA polymerase sigma-70 factor (ECF subfamily)